MSVCKDLEPKKVFQVFEEICRIPHGSGNTKAISDYCVAFAKERNLEYWQDENYNVVIKKPATLGYEQAEPVIIQGHMDMVCEKEADCEINFEKEGLTLFVDGDFLKAKGTTLGGDDGIAIAYAFALLDSNDIAHPALEVILTVDEEIGMLGAESIDLSMIRGKRLLNIDSDEEGIFLASCAGGLRADCEIPVGWTNASGVVYEIKVHGLLGGHSGGEIHKERANGIIIAGRVLKAIHEEINYSLASFYGGLMDNAIPREATAQIIVDPQEQDALTEVVEELNSMLKNEFKTSDPDITVTLCRQEEGTVSVLDTHSLMKVLLFLKNVPYGIQNMSMDIPGLVETSLNPGILKLKEEHFQLSFSIRSSVTSRKYNLLDQLVFLTEFLGGEVLTSGDYPAWEYKPQSDLRDLMAQTYRDLFGEEAKIQAIHAGLECGILSGKIEGLDCISFGPNNFDIHTPQERLSISSTKKIWDLIVEFLKRAK